LNILITGGAGFIGSHLIGRLLAKDNKVTCIDDFSLGSKKQLCNVINNKKFNLYNHDLSDLESIKPVFSNSQFDMVYHFAANSNIQLGSHNHIIDFKNTFISTMNILECMKMYEIRNLVFSSSSAIYGNFQGKISEISGPLLPISNYGAAKLSSEAFISSYCESYDINSWIIRFPNVVGWRLTHGVIFDFINKLLKTPNELIILGNGKQKKPYLFISDLLDAFEIIINQKPNRVQLFNVASNSSSTVNYIADTVINELNLKNVKKSYTGGDIGWVGDVPTFSYDIFKLNKLGWSAEFSSDEAIKLSIKKELEFRNI